MWTYFRGFNFPSLCEILMVAWLSVYTEVVGIRCGSVGDVLNME